MFEAIELVCFVSLFYLWIILCHSVDKARGIAMKDLNIDAFHWGYLKNVMLVSLLSEI